MATDKSQLRFGDRTFLQQICGSLRPAVRTIAIVGRPNQFATGIQSTPQSANAHSPIPTLDADCYLADKHADRGPLEAIATGLEYLAGIGSDAAFVTTCDTPLLKPEIVRFLLDRIGEFDCVMPTDGKHIFGITALYRTETHLEMRRLLEAGIRRVIDLPKYLWARLLPLDDFREFDPGLDCFVNVNTPEDYARLLARFDQPRAK